LGMAHHRFDDTVLHARRQRIADALGLKDEVLLVGAGEPVGIPGGQDQTYAFLSHQEYFYLTDTETEGGVVAFDPATGWDDFVPVVTRGQRVWEGKEQAPGKPLTELAGWLAARRGRGVVMLGAPLAGVVSDAARVAEVRGLFTHARRAKDDAEIERMRQAVSATAPAFARVRELLANGTGGSLSERDIQVEIESAFARHGATRNCYGTIVAAGSDAAVLHFHPGSRKAEDGDLLLIDAGAEVDRYGADVTRTFAVGAVDSARRDLHAAVTNAMHRATAACVAGAEWVDIHLIAAREMAEGLVGMGVLRCSAEDAVERGTMGLFFPHGIGHMIGLGVRDATGRLPGRGPTRRAGIVTIRCDFPLQVGYTMTVEPGCYFIPPLLNEGEAREQHRDAVNWPLVDSLIASGIGGVRMEDNIVVTDGAPENLTGMISAAIR
jgi:Xaa-Pro aminopeptidase